MRAHIKGKALEEALFTLARMGASPKVIDLRKRVQESARQFPLQHLMPVVIVNQDGKVIERKPSIYANDPDEVEAAIRAEMFSQAMIDQGIHAQATVEPAREQINSEHQVEVDDFLPLVSDNPLVPAGREYIYARGLHAGLTGDFLVAAHLLILQLEHSIRYLLVIRGVFTSGLDSQGIQEERNLNTLLYLPEAKGNLGRGYYLRFAGVTGRALWFKPQKSPGPCFTEPGCLLLVSDLVSLVADITPLLPTSSCQEPREKEKS